MSFENKQPTAEQRMNIELSKFIKESSDTTISGTDGAAECAECANRNDTENCN
jgi:hypothetical protein